MSLTVPLALAADLLLGEPPTPLHPTVWMGRWIAAGRARSAGARPSLALAAGAALTLGGVALAAGAAWLVDRARRRAGAGAPVLAALSLKPALSLGALLQAGAAVEMALRAGRIARARRLLATHLVSRDTRTLGAVEIAGAAISSLAENLCDSIVAPVLAYSGASLPGAYAYRFINTADAMVGYRTPELEWLGKFAARSDDACNLVPARLAALLIALAAPASGGSVGGALRVAWRDAHRTPSPNAGWPMAAMAGALDVRLVKRDAYVLHPAGGTPGPGSIARARRIIGASAVLVAGAGMLA